MIGRHSRINRAPFLPVAQACRREVKSQGGPIKHPNVPLPTLSRGQFLVPSETTLKLTVTPQAVVDNMPVQSQYSPVPSDFDEAEKLVLPGSGSDESLSTFVPHQQPNKALVRSVYALSAVAVTAAAANLVVAILVRSANVEIPLSALPRPDIFAGLSL